MSNRHGMKLNILGQNIAIIMYIYFDDLGQLRETKRVWRASDTCYD